MAKTPKKKNLKLLSAENKLKQLGWGENVQASHPTYEQQCYWLLQMQGFKYDYSLKEWIYAGQ